MLKLTNCCVLLLLTMGCGGSDRPDTHSVSGQVNYKGAPVADANVMFASDKGRPASGTTDAQGKFTLTTYVTGDGAVEGDYQVLVQKLEPAKDGDPYAKQKSLVPEKYGDLKTTPLKQTVATGGNSSVTIDLED